eukprot:6470292-Amphidinium_carterae.1
MWCSPAERLLFSCAGSRHGQNWRASSSQGKVYYSHRPRGSNRALPLVTEAVPLSSEREQHSYESMTLMRHSCVQNLFLNVALVTSEGLVFVPCSIGP